MMVCCFRSMTRSLLLVGAVWSLPAVACATLPLQSNHGGIKAVPAPGPVQIDGRLDDWDLSGEMYVYGARRNRGRYSVRVHAMWDRGSLYLGLRWRDPTPMINRVDPDRAAGEGWMADAFQGRFVTDQTVHLTAWYSSKGNKAVAQFNYNDAISPVGMRLFRGEGESIRDDSGFAMVLAKDSDNSGYTQEMRIPWALLYQKPAPAAGLKCRFTGEYYWGGPSATKWPAVTWADPMNQEQPQRIVIYQNPGAWGQLELVAQGHLPKVEAEDSELLLQGPIVIRFDVPRDAVKFSLAIDDAQGRRLRNLASHANVRDYTVKSGPKVRTLEVCWDGRSDGTWDKARSLFLGDFVQPGQYVARVLVHDGIGVVHAGSFYNPGTPPWPTASGSGGWGSDHSIFSAVGAMPAVTASKGRVFLGSHGGECGAGFIGLDGDGRKIWEWVRLGSGASQIATTDRYVYFCFRDVSGTDALGRVNPDTGEEIAFANAPNVKLPGPAGGLAVADGIVAVSIPAQNQVLLLDAESGDRRKEITVENPGSLAFAAEGRLVGVSGGKSLFCVRVAEGSVSRVTLAEVAAPRAVAADRRDMLYVSDATESNVKVFSGVGHSARLVRAIGEPGGHRPGPWNGQRMATPAGLAVEYRGDGTCRLWATESNFSPRRVSVWAEDGRLIRDYLGNTGYMGTGGLLSDDVPELGIIDGVLFGIDYRQRTYAPLEVLGGAPDPVGGRQSPFRVGLNFKAGGSFGNGYHFLSSASGTLREYYVEAANAACMVFMRRGGRWLCVAALGPATFAQGLPSKPPSERCVFSWSDVDCDGFPSADEIQWQDTGRPNVLNGGWGYRCGKDLVFYHTGLSFRPMRFLADGAPVYDVTRAERLPGELGNAEGDVYPTQFGYVSSQPKPGYVEPHGVIHGLWEITGYDAGGRKRWTYPSYWNAVHGAFSAPMAMPGVIMGVLKLNGVVAGGERDVIFFRGNTGQDFVLRDDGLYVGELFTDQRMAPSSLPDDMDIVGVAINDTSLGGECFNGMIARQRDGRVRLTYGTTDVRIAEVTGLETIRTLADIPIGLTAPQVAEARAFQPVRETSEPSTCDVVRGGPLSAERAVFRAPGTIVIRSGREEVGRSLLRYDETNLYVGWMVDDATPLQNRGTSAPLAFKTGDSVNLFIASGNHGGVRVLLAMLKEKPTAVVYKPSGPGDRPFVFESPVRKSSFRYVGEEAAVQFTWKADAAGYLVVASIPWSVLDIIPKPGLALRGDVAILLGDGTGAVTAQRVHWVDKETNVVNDVPTEAEFSPERWGTFRLK